jgi:methyl-accepting chemotaxis protein
MQLPYPHQTSLYTVVEPMRLSDFMDLQYQAAASLTETNKKINDLLDDQLIKDLRSTVVNIRLLTAQATTTLEKTEKLIDESRKDLEAMISQTNKITDEFTHLSKNINSVIGDENFKANMYETMKSINNLSEKLTPIIGAVDAEQFASDLNASMSNIVSITNAVNSMTQDDKLKCKISNTLDNLNKALYNVSLSLETINNPKEEQNIKTIMNDTSETVKNLRKFSEKLNKRFLLFRLMF